MTEPTRRGRRATSPVSASDDDLRSWRDRVASLWSDHVLEALCEYVSVPCLSPLYDRDWASHGHLRHAAAMMARWCRERAAAGGGPPIESVEVVELEGRTPLLVVQIGAGRRDRAGTRSGAALVYGHLDKQPPLGEWREGLDPFTAVRRGDRLYGRGTGDDGYALFAAMAGVEALAGDHGPVTIVIEASEESGSTDLDAHLDALGPRLGQPELVLCLDSGCVTYDRLWLTSSLRGALGGTLRVDVLTEGVHSGAAGGVVPSSFRLLRSLLSRLEDEATGAIVLPELHADLPEAHRLRIEEVARQLPGAGGNDLPVVDGLELAGRGAADRLRARTWEPALAITGMDGLPAAADAGNVLRPFTAAKFSIRLPPSCDADRAARSVVAALTADPPSGARVRVDLDLSADGWVAPEPEPWLADAFDRASLACFGRPAASCGEGGSIPFLGTLVRRFPGAALAATGVLGPQSNAHGPNEFLHLPMAEAVSVAVAGALSALGRR